MLTKLYVKSAVFLNSLKKDERGVTAIEYAIIASAVAAVVAVAFNGETNSLESVLTDSFKELSKTIKNLGSD